MKHDIKIEEPFYLAVLDGCKTFEIRYNDRGYQAGDTVEMSIAGRSKPHLSADIGYVSSYNQQDNWVVFSLLNVRKLV